MGKIVLTPDQLQVVHLAMGLVQVCDTQGKVLGTLDPVMSPEFIQELKQRAATSGPWHSGEHLQHMLRFLDEAWAREGAFDEKRMELLIQEFDARNPS